MPKCKIPAGVIVNVNKSGTMDKHLMLDYIQRVLVPYTKKEPCLLLLDEFSLVIAHKCSYTDANLKAENINSVYIPGGYTDSLQALDVSINKPLKGHFREDWFKWFNDCPKFTKAGNRQRPQYEQLLQMACIIQLRKYEQVPTW